MPRLLWDAIWWIKWVEQHTLWASFRAEEAGKKAWLTENTQISAKKKHNCKSQLTLKSLNLYGLTHCFVKRILNYCDTSFQKQRSLANHIFKIKGDHPECPWNCAVLNKNITKFGQSNEQIISSPYWMIFKHSGDLKTNMPTVHQHL